MSKAGYMHALHFATPSGTACVEVTAHDLEPISNWLRRLSILCLSMGALTSTAPSFAQQAYPVKPVRVVLSQGPGGTADITIRAVGQKLAERTGQPVLIENRPGAGGISALQLVSSAAPDGYTLLLMVTAHPISKSLLKSMPVDLEKDFVPISSLALFDLVLLAKNGTPLKTIADLDRLSRTKPGGIFIGTTSVGSIQNLGAHLFNALTGFKSTIITYKTSADILLGIRRGDLDVGFDSYSGLKGGIDSRQVDTIAVTGPKRSTTQPDVPTMKEIGLPNYEVTGFNSLFAPAGTPAEVISLLNRHVNEIIASKEIRERFRQLGIEPKASTPNEMGLMLKHDMEKWAQVIKRAGIEKQ